MKQAQNTYTLTYDPLDQQIDLVGSCRPAEGDEVAQIFNYLVTTHDQVQGTLRLNFRRLRYINAAGIKALSLFIAYARGRNTLKIKLIASGILAWSERVLPTLCDVWDEVEFSVYDKDFYKSQDIIEDLEFIPLLRNQTRILWPQEKEILRRVAAVMSPCSSAVHLNQVLSSGLTIQKGQLSTHVIHKTSSISPTPISNEETQPH